MPSNSGSKSRLDKLKQWLHPRNQKEIDGTAPAAPINHLPDELLLTIFLLFRDHWSRKDYLLLPSLDSNSFNPAIRLLEVVCKRWKRLVRETAQFWTETPVLTVREYDMCVAAHGSRMVDGGEVRVLNARALEMYRARAKGALLRVELRVFTKRKKEEIWNHRRLKEVISSSIEQWEELSLGLNFADIPLLDSLFEDEGRRKAPLSLRRVKLTFTMMKSDDFRPPEEPARFLMDCEVLKSLAIVYPEELSFWRLGEKFRILSALSVPPQIAHLTLSFVDPVYAFQMLLSLADSIESVSLKFLLLDRQLFTANIQLPRLRELTVINKTQDSSWPWSIPRVLQSFDRLTAPSLTKLHFNAGIDLQTFPPMLRRSSNTDLRVLILDWPFDESDEQSFRLIFTQCPNIAHFSLQKPPHAVLRLLHFEPTAAVGSVYLPRLRRLEFTNVNESRRQGRKFFISTALHRRCLVSPVANIAGVEPLEFLAICYGSSSEAKKAAMECGVWPEDDHVMMKIWGAVMRLRDIVTKDFVPAVDEGDPAWVVSFVAIVCVISVLKNI